MFSASSRKSSSSAIVSANSSTSAGGLASAATGMRPTRNGATHAITARSWRTSRATDGRCTFTTTASPVTSVAACTWAIDAAANGVAIERREHGRRAGGRGPPRPPRRTTANGSGGTWSRHFLNSVTSSSGNMPSPAEMIWPSLMYVGPEPLGRDPQPPREAQHRPRPPRLAVGTTPPLAAPPTRPAPSRARRRPEHTRSRAGTAAAAHQLGHLGPGRRAALRPSPRRHGSAAGSSITHGPWSVNEPKSSDRVVGHDRRVCGCGTTPLHERCRHRRAVTGRRAPASRRQEPRGGCSR